MDSTQLLEKLSAMKKSNLAEALNFQQLTVEQLNKRGTAGGWTILECIEHLNLYGDFYIPEIKNRISQAKHKPSESFKSGIMGHYFAKMMLPKENLKKIKTFKSMDPIHKSLGTNVLDKFINQQKEILEILETAKNVNLTKTKTSISISKWIKLRLGDTFQVLIYHNLRHIMQAKKVYESF